MKAVILAGGFGTRISEETTLRPKPMVEIGERPILWHIMRIYAAHGITEFVVCCGYKAHYIKDYFANYFLRNANITVDLQENRLEFHESTAEPWKVTLADTGPNTMTGGRLRRVRDFVGDETFCFTYGDGVGDIDITKSIEFHRAQGVAATMTAVQPPGRFGAFSMKKDQHKVTSFKEKPDGDGAWINGGFFVLEPTVFEYLSGDDCVWEREPLENLAQDDRLAAYRHHGFWQPMDTVRDKMLLEKLWQSEKAPWKVW
jgi:glucose-1-phosphate cytidylyltransferase